MPGVNGDNDESAGLGKRRKVIERVRGGIRGGREFSGALYRQPAVGKVQVALAKLFRVNAGGRHNGAAAVFRGVRFCRLLDIDG
jgi:hypothetical protein